MSRNIYRITHPDGTTVTGNRERICTELGVTYASLSIAEKRGYKLKGCAVEAVYKKPSTFYCLSGNGILKTCLTAKEIASITGLKSNAVSVYAKSGTSIKGWKIQKVVQDASQRILFCRSSAMYRCPDYVYRNDDEKCDRHQCTNPKGLYVLESAMSEAN